VVSVLVTANDQKFTYAGIFCGLTAVIGTGIAILPRIIDIASGLLGLSRRREISEEQHEEK